MMKPLRVLILIEFILLSASCQGQMAEKVIEVIQPQDIYVSSAFGISGKSRQVLSFQLPEKTIRWYYSFSAYRN
jgi:hypothetical protein